MLGVRQCIQGLFICAYPDQKSRKISLYDNVLQSLSVSVLQLVGESATMHTSCTLQKLMLTLNTANAMQLHTIFLFFALRGSIENSP